MTEQTYIKGKDRDPKSTIETMLSKLAKLGIEIFHGLHNPRLSLEGFDNHQELMNCIEAARKNNNE